jgi:tRNA pseudouridine38-40 synthase
MQASRRFYHIFFIFLSSVEMIDAAWALSASKDDHLCCPQKQQQQRYFHQDDLKNRADDDCHHPLSTLRSWWDSHPFEAAEGVMQHLLLSDRTTCCDTTGGHLLLEPIQLLRTDADSTIFDRFYLGQFPVPLLSSALIPPPKMGTKRKVLSFRLDLAYDGKHFCGWQRQPGRTDSVHETVERVIDVAYCQHRTTTEGPSSRLPRSPRAEMRVSGRTDAGVNASNQVARLRIYRPEHILPTAQDVHQVLEDAAASSNFTWRCLAVTPASVTFHPTFDSTSRSYVYLLDYPNSGDDRAPTVCWNNKDVIVQRLNVLLNELEGQELDYFSFSYGPVKTETTRCHLTHAQARLFADKSCFAIELTGDRFLRRMVRILVSTALELAVDSSGKTFSLLDLCRASDRQLTAKAAPPFGLIFVGATMKDTN